MSIDFYSERLEARVPSPDGSKVTVRTVEVRRDPLLGTTSRVAEGVRLQHADADALARLRAPDPNCPFCGDGVEARTPRIDAAIGTEPRIRHGETVVFPNLVPYSQYAAVALFTHRHWLDVDAFTEQLIADNLHASLRYMRAVYSADPEARNAAWNVNYLFPSGGSLPHPHAQLFVDPIPTTMMRLQREAAERYFHENGNSFWEDMAETERQGRTRFLWDAGSTAWMTAFAPIGFNDVRAVVHGKATLLELDEADVADLAKGMARVLRGYAALGFNSFNASLVSGPLDGSASFRVNLTMVTRTAMVPYYRSDAMFLERLHWEAVVGRTPEALADELRGETTD